MPLYVRFLDVGQGDSALVIFPDNTTMLVDCGTKREGNQGKMAIQGIRQALNIPAAAFQIDHLIITHADEDHYCLLRYLAANHITFGDVTYGNAVALYENNRNGETNWTRDFLTNLPAAQISPWQALINPAAGAAKYFTPAATPFQIGGADMWIIAGNSVADPGNKDKKNENSIALLIKYEGNTLYLMGDTTVDSENFIMTAYQHNAGFLSPDDGRACILKVGHHGSDTSSSKKWLGKIKPNMAMISSDMQKWGGHKGIPDSLKITDFQACPLTNFAKPSGPAPADLKHSIVYYDVSPAVDYFALKDVGYQALCTTLGSLEVAVDPVTKIKTPKNMIGASWTVDFMNNGTLVYGWTTLVDPS